MSFNNGFAGIQRVAVICRNKTAQSINGWTTLTNWAEVQDPANSFDPVAGTFTAPRAGVYQFSIGDGFTQAVGSYYGLSITKNGTQLYTMLKTAQSLQAQYDALSAEVELATGDTVQARGYCGAAANDITGASISWFTITEKNTNF